MIGIAITPKYNIWNRETGEKVKNKFGKWALLAIIPVTLLSLILSACSQSTSTNLPTPTPATSSPAPQTSTTASSSPSSTSAPSSAEITVNPSQSIVVIEDKTVRADKSFDGKEVTMAVGGSLEVSLEANHTTGFSWELTQISDPAVLEKVSNTYDTPTFKIKKGEPPPVGVGGMEFWDFKALKQGTSTISMEYSQPWNGGTKGAQKFSLTVNVN
jgi:inhibitor of cysteine peptidase